MTRRILVDVKYLNVLVQECKQKNQAEELPELDAALSNFSLFRSEVNYGISRMSVSAGYML